MEVILELASVLSCTRRRAQLVVYLGEERLAALLPNTSGQSDPLNSGALSKRTRCLKWSLSGIAPQLMAPSLQNAPDEMTSF